MYRYEHGEARNDADDETEPVERESRIEEWHPRTEGSKVLQRKDQDEIKVYNPMRNSCYP